ncbi:MAG: S1 RNA-binding domain-containing protein [Chloroflexota bacterium]
MAKERVGPFEVGSIINVEITRILPIGVRVKLPNGHQGLIRDREIGWANSANGRANSQPKTVNYLQKTHKPSKQSLKQALKVGERRKALVLNNNLQTLELSLRLAESDPWEVLEEHYQKDQIVSGVITNVVHFGVFVELEPAVTGLLHITQIPFSGHLDERFWIGDHVRVLVDTIDVQRRRIGLSLMGLRQRQRQVFAPASYAKTETQVASVLSSTQDNINLYTVEVAVQQTGYTHSSVSSPLAVVVIEDDSEQNKATCRWFQQAGHQVTNAFTGVDGLALIEQHKPDLVVTDVRLPEMDGIGVVQNAIKQRPQTHFVLTTDWATADERCDDLDALAEKGATLLVKPLLPEDFTEMLQAFFDQRTQRHPRRLGEEPVEYRVSNIDDSAKNEHSINQPSVYSANPTQRFQESARSTVTGPKTNSSGTKAGPSTQSEHDIHQLTTALRQFTHASRVIVFKVDSYQRQVTLLSETRTASYKTDVLSDLIHSPVRDVAEDQLMVKIPNIQQAEAYTKYLKPLLDFQACMGVPVLNDLQHCYALFVFWAQPVSFSSSVEYMVESTARAVGAAIEKQQHYEHIAEMQRLALMGHLSRALVHEVNHHLSPINFTLDTLGEAMKELNELLQKDSPSNADMVADVLDEANELIGQLNQSTRNLTRTSRMFGRVTVQDQEGMVRIDETVRTAIELVRDLADRSKIRLHLVPPERLLMTRMKASQLQQIVLNVLLNAIQHIAIFAEEQGPQVSGGQIEITLQTSNRSNNRHGLQGANGETVIQIEIGDDGPGIHRSLWEQIFELGFTTRQGEGSGMGLYISRQLVENVGGRIYIKQSEIFSGSRVVIELPILL